MEIKTVKLTQIHPYPGNPRVNDQAVDAVAESIRQCGYRAKIIVDETMTILAGHTRYKALKKLGVKKAEVQIETDLTDEQKRKYRLLDNKTAELADWDFDALKVELDGLDFDGFDFGFDLGDDDGAEQEAVEDDYDADPPEQPKAKPGDLYQLGRHRLMCGDATSAEDVSALLGGARGGICLTDPPYGVNIVQDNIASEEEHFGTTRRPANRAIAPATLYAPIIGDDSTETAKKHYDLIKDKTDVQIFFGGNYFTDFLPPSRCWAVWDKGVPDKAFFAPVELAWISKDGNAKLYKRLWSGLVREGDRKTEGLKRIHPTQKPVALMADIVKDFTEEGGAVVDCFGGSGSTLIACEQLGRACYMMELAPRYVDVIVGRWEKFTGEKAVLLHGGQA